jgi:hypothetical protein
VDEEGSRPESKEGVRWNERWEREKLKTEKRGEEEDSPTTGKAMLFPGWNYRPSHSATDKRMGSFFGLRSFVLRAFILFFSKTFAMISPSSIIALFCDVVVDVFVSVSGLFAFCKVENVGRQTIGCTTVLLKCYFEREEAALPCALSFGIHSFPSGFPPSLPL